MKAKSIKGNSTEEITTALIQSMADGYKPTLAFIFMSLKLEREAIQLLLDKEGIAIFGVTTAGEFTEQGIENNSIVILLLDVNPLYFKIVLKEHGIGKPLESASQIGEIGVSNFLNPAFIIAVSNIKTSGEDIIKGLVEKAGSDVNIIGGYSGDAQTLEGSVFTNHLSSESGLLALVLDQDKINVKGIAVSGWKPLGTVKTVTESEGLWVHTIDNQPAMDIVQKYIGTDIINENTPGNIVKINSTYPLQVNRKGSSPGMVPTLFFNKTDGSVMCGQALPAGTTFRFSLPPDFDVIDTVIESSRNIKEKELPQADALVVFSCIGRFETLGPMMPEEIQGLAKTWNKPMAGFFSLGEFGRVVAGEPEFHGTTCSWVALKEK